MSYCQFCGSDGSVHKDSCFYSQPLTTGVDERSINLVPAFQIQGIITFDEKLVQLCQYLDALMIIEVAMDSVDFKNGLYLQKLHEYLKTLIEKEISQIKDMIPDA